MLFSFEFADAGALPVQPGAAEEKACGVCGGEKDIVELFVPSRVRVRCVRGEEGSRGERGEDEGEKVGEATNVIPSLALACVFSVPASVPFWVRERGLM